MLQPKARFILVAELEGFHKAPHEPVVGRLQRGYQVQRIEAFIKLAAKFQLVPGMRGHKGSQHGHGQIEGRSGIEIFESLPFAGIDRRHLAPDAMQELKVHIDLPIVAVELYHFI